MDSSRCFVCCQRADAAVFNLSSESKYSRKALHELVQSISGVQVINRSVPVCTECTTKFNTFDEHFTKAMEVREDLKSLIDMSSGIVLIKTEPKCEDDRDETTPKWMLEDQKQSAEDPIFDPSLLVEPLMTIQQTTRKGQSSKRRPNEKQVHKCLICSKSFPTPSLLDIHYSSHSSERNYKCSICFKSFKYKYYLKVHIKSHSERPAFFCDICGASCLFKKNIANHIITHHSDVRNFLCSFCPKNYATIGALQNHLKIHTKPRNKFCETCGASFLTSYMLARHLRTHSSISAFVCAFCNKSFKENYNLTSHIKRVHSEHKNKPPTEVVKHQCTICEKKFDQKGQLRQHLIKSHQVVFEEEGDDA